MGTSGPKPEFGECVGGGAVDRGKRPGVPWGETMTHLRAIRRTERRAGSVGTTGRKRSPVERLSAVDTTGILRATAGLYDCVPQRLSREVGR